VLVRSLVIWDHTYSTLPLRRGDSHTFTPMYCWYSFIDPGRMKGWVDLSTVGSELLRNDITGANCSIVTPHWAGVCEQFAQGRYLAASRPRLEPATFRSLIWHSSHYSTRPQNQSYIYCIESSQKIKHFYTNKIEIIHHRNNIPSILCIIPLHALQVLVEQYIFICVATSWV